MECDGIFLKIRILILLNYINIVICWTEPWGKNWSFTGRNFDTQIRILLFTFSGKNIKGISSAKFFCEPAYEQFFAKPLQDPP